MVLSIGLSIIGFALQLAFIKVEKKGDMKLALVLKTIAAFTFVLVGLINLVICENKQHGLIIVSGLTCCACGDFLLNYQFLKKEPKPWFVAGAFANLFGHIFFISSLFPIDSGVMKSTLIVSGVVALFLVTWIQFSVKATIDLRIFGGVYLSALVFITVETFISYLAFPNNLGSLIMSIGAALFTYSDVLLIIDAYGNKKEWMRAGDLVTYYLGQLFIAASILYFI